jgi:hypothetical protein
MGSNIQKLVNSRNTAACNVPPLGCWGVCRGATAPPAACNHEQQRTSRKTQAIIAAELQLCCKTAACNVTGIVHSKVLVGALPQPDACKTDTTQKAAGQKAQSHH